MRKPNMAFDPSDRKKICLRCHQQLPLLPRQVIYKTTMLKGADIRGICLRADGPYLWERRWRMANLFVYHSPTPPLATHSVSSHKTMETIGALFGNIISAGRQALALREEGFGKIK